MRPFFEISRHSSSSMVHASQAMRGGKCSLSQFLQYEVTNRPSFRASKKGEICVKAASSCG